MFTTPLLPKCKPSAQVMLYRTPTYIYYLAGSEDIRYVFIDQYDLLLYLLLIILVLLSQSCVLLKSYFRKTMPRVCERNLKGKTQLTQLTELHCTINIIRSSFQLFTILILIACSHVYNHETEKTSGHGSPFYAIPGSV